MGSRSTKRGPVGSRGTIRGQVISGEYLARIWVRGQFGMRFGEFLSKWLGRLTVWGRTHELCLRSCCVPGSVRGWRGVYASRMNQDCLK